MRSGEIVVDIVAEFRTELYIDVAFVFYAVKR